MSKYNATFTNYLRSSLSTIFMFFAVGICIQIICVVLKKILLLHLKTVSKRFLGV